MKRGAPRLYLDILALNSPSYAKSQRKYALTHTTILLTIFQAAKNLEEAANGYLIKCICELYVFIYSR